MYVSETKLNSYSCKHTKLFLNLQRNPPSVPVEKQTSGFSFLGG